MAKTQKSSLNIFNQTDVMLTVTVLGIISIMILPVPVMLLDLLLAVSITIAIIILLVSLYVEEPLDFSSFPTVLLIVTLYRLALNVATTRQILLHGAEGEDAAGAVIQSFGQFVVGGNFIVGFIIFIILVLINFMVITKGSGRVAEVAARFTLDAMPGKQMAIDADLNAGILDENEAKRMREEIQSRADFYGAMDGASKFVRGDAVAGLIITAINIIGGLIIGAVQFGMPIGESAQRFTILTVGDGLLSQIPSLIISTAAGIVVTRAGEEGGLGSKLVDQLFKNSKILFTTGGALLFLAIIPGLPKFSFFTLSLILIYLGYVLKTKGTVEETEAEETEEVEEISEEDEVKNLLDMDVMELEIGFNLIPLVDAAQGGTLLSRIKSIRRQVALDLGFLVPPVRIRDNLQIEATAYIMLIKGVKIVSGIVYPDRYMVMNPEGSIDEIEGIDTKEPAFGLPAKWVDGAEKERAEMEGFTIVDPATVIATHLTEMIKTNAYELIGRQETQELLDKLKERYPKLVEDLVPNILDLGIVHRVLQNLLKEKVSIRNLQSILEVLASFGMQNKDVNYLTEKVRVTLKRQITEGLLAADGTLYLFTLASRVEQFVAQNIQQTDDGREIVIDPSVGQRLLSAIIDKSDELSGKGITPLMVVSPPIRLPFRRFVEKFIPNIQVISHNEISENAKVDSLGVLEIEL